MAELILVTGGARSGKSRFAESLLKSYNRPLYVATALPLDAEMADRIKHHQLSRDARWITLEAYSGIGEKLLPFLAEREAILLDCLTVMITNLMFDDRTIDWEKAAPQAVKQLEDGIAGEIDAVLAAVRAFPGRVVVVSNEVGMGLVPEYPLGRYFRDIAGRMNQKLGQVADKVFLLVSGIPVTVKG